MSETLEEMIPVGMAPHQRKVVGAVLRHADRHGIQIGGRLPSIRDIAANTGIAHATVAKAIKRLSAAGVVESRGRNGTILIKNLKKPPVPEVQRFIMFTHVNDPGVAALSTVLLDFELRNAFHVASPGTEVMAVHHTPQGGEESIEKVIDFFYVDQGRPAGTVFGLGGCSVAIKLMFEKRGIPAIILGGREEGVSLPNVTADIGSMVGEVMRLIQDAQAFPALFVVDLDFLFGEQAELVRRFTTFATKNDDPSRRLAIVRTSSAYDIFCGHLVQALRSENRPRTIIARGDESATRIARVCSEMGLLDQIRIISMESSALGQRFIPSLTGLHRDVQGIVRNTLSLAKRLVRGEDLRGVRMEVPAMMVYRESFPNPHVLASRTVESRF
ncbi:MAG: GntR family transcriptional regulator [Phycisphaerales bacterium]|nr:GntR family transcriptional regulator [Phycisphaerales bacterium]